MERGCQFQLKTVEINFYLALEINQGIPPFMRSKCGEISTLYHLRDSCVAVARATQSNRAVQNDTIRRPPREVEGGAEPSGGGAV